MRFVAVIAWNRYHLTKKVLRMHLKVEIWTSLEGKFDICVNFTSSNLFVNCTKSHCGYKLTVRFKIPSTSMQLPTASLLYIAFISHPLFTASSLYLHSFQEATLLVVWSLNYQKGQHQILAVQFTLKSVQSQEQIED